jgi:adenylate cyclase
MGSDRQSSRSWRRGRTLPRLLAIAVPLASVALVALLSVTPLLKLLEARSLDLRFEARGPLDPDREVVIIAVDEATFGTLRLRYPFPPATYAALIDKLTEAGASVIAFDFLYAEPWRDPAEDHVLAEALKAHGNAVWAYHLDEGSAPVLPIMEIRESAANLGFINLPDERDSRIRRIRTRLGEADSFAAAIVRCYAGFLPPSWENQDLHLVNFRGGPGTYPRFSMGDVLLGKFPKGAFRNRICLVGATFEAAHDIFPTPYHRASAPDTPGVEIHANAVGNMLRGDRLVPLPELPQWLVLVLLAFLPAVLFHRERPWWALAVWLLASCGWAAWSFWLFLSGGVTLLVAPLSVLSTSFWSGAFANYILERDRRREIRDLFASYVDPSVVAWLLRHPGEVNLEGQRIQATILDTDIEGFTTITEQLDPSALITQLNKYFENITDAALQAGGLCDKYVGDALMVIYGFPIGGEDHALRAFMAAKEILARVDRMNLDWERTGQPVMKTRIGICSGEVIIGNVGGSKRKTFTAMGDAANMASRLEGLNKRFGTRVILSESTAVLLPPDIPLRDLGETPVRGISKPIRVFSPAFDVAPSLTPPGIPTSS